YLCTCLLQPAEEAGRLATADRGTTLISRDRFQISVGLNSLRKFFILDNRYHNYYQKKQTLVMFISARRC
ncbi:MAG: hypothetical protein ACTSQ8_11910, partial [Candidatus Helarchaeota archaeon]